MNHTWLCPDTDVTAFQYTFFFSGGLLWPSHSKGWISLKFHFFLSLFHNYSVVFSVTPLYGSAPAWLEIFGLFIEKYPTHFEVSWQTKSFILTNTETKSCTVGTDFAAYTSGSTPPPSTSKVRSNMWMQYGTETRESKQLRTIIHTYFIHII